MSAAEADGGKGRMGDSKTSGSFGRERLREIYPVLMERSPHPDARRRSLLTSDFLKGFQIGYILRGEKPVPVTKQGFSGWRISKEAVHAAALSNLSKDSAGATFKFFDSPEGGVLLFDGEGEIHSSRLILPNLYRWLQKFMGGPFVAGIPNRDVLITVAETNRTALAGLPADLDASYRGRRHPLTLKTFRVTPGGVALMG